MFRLFVTASFLLVSTSAVADDNAFNANMEHPTISAAIMEFEEVCFPFIAHETELTPEQDREVFQSLMVEAGYDLNGEERKHKWMPLLSYSPTSCPAGSFPPVTPRVEGKFTVFPASSRVDAAGHVLTPKKTLGSMVINGQKIETITAMGPMCETLTVVMTATSKTFYEQQRYENRISPISAYLTWQKVPDVTGHIGVALVNTPGISYEELKIRTSFPPASSCEIHVEDKSLTTEVVESAIITQDSDWKKRNVIDPETKEIIPDAYSWSQCTKQDEENYAYKASLTDGSFSLSVKTLQDDEIAADYDCGPAEEN